MKKDKRFIQSERAIIEASIQTLLVNTSAGMSDIAEVAGVGRATLYRHFESREALIEKLAFICSEAIEAAIAPLQHLSGRAAIEAHIEATLPLINRFHFLTTLWAIVADSDAIQQLDNQLIDDMGTLIDQAKAAGDINPSLPTIWIASLYQSTLMAAGWLIASGDITIDEAIVYTKQSFFSGCGVTEREDAYDGVDIRT